MAEKEMAEDGIAEQRTAVAKYRHIAIVMLTER